jgi:hypothetical protein
MVGAGAGDEGGAGQVARAVPPSVDVVCNGNKGTFIVARQMMCCRCRGCEAKAEKQGLALVEISPTEFERHSGEPSTCAVCFSCLCAAPTQCFIQSVHMCAQRVCPSTVKP